MSDYTSDKIKELKDFLNLPIDEIFIKTMGGDVQNQTIYNIFSILKIMISILECMDEENKSWLTKNY